MALYNKYFYNGLTRKYITAFGSLFENIQVVRADSAGAEVNRERVPLTFAPKEKYIYKLKKDLDLDNRGPSIKLPRMSFEMDSMDYAPERKSMSMQKICIDAGQGKQYTYAPVPYNLSYTLSIYTKSLDEMHQIIEQIIPFFTPEYAVKIRPITGATDFKDVLRFTLNSVTPSDSYEGSFDDRRMIIWTLTFGLPTNFWGPIRGGWQLPGPGAEAGVVYSTQTNTYIDETRASTVVGTPVQVDTQSPYQNLEPYEIDVDQPWTFDTLEYGADETVPPYPPA